MFTACQLKLSHFETQSIKTTPEAMGFESDLEAIFFDDEDDEPREPEISPWVAVQAATVGGPEPIEPTSSPQELNIEMQLQPNESTLKSGSTEFASTLLPLCLRWVL